MSLEEQDAYFSAHPESLPDDGEPAPFTFLISTAEQLHDLALKVNNQESYSGGLWASASYRQVGDLDLSGYAEGEGWQRQLHIYVNPFYYIDYCLAQTVSLQFWALLQKDKDNAWQHYMAYTKQGGRKFFSATGSSWDVGSSSSSTRGRNARTAASDSSCLRPPESVSVSRWSQSSNPKK